MLTLAEEYGIIERAGARYTFEYNGSIQKAHGMEKAMQEFDVPIIQTLVEEKLRLEREAFQQSSERLEERGAHEQTGIS